MLLRGKTTLPYILSPLYLFACYLPVKGYWWKPIYISSGGSFQGSRLGCSQGVLWIMLHLFKLVYVQVCHALWVVFWTVLKKEDIKKMWYWLLAPNVSQNNWPRTILTPVISPKYFFCRWILVFDGLTWSHSSIITYQPLDVDIFHYYKHKKFEIAIWVLQSGAYCL